ncbi:DUF1328 domain-containing protein [Gluconobacter sp. R71646]|uniref:UPF0391 membrane protein HKD31_13650 n=1 Tax=Gluconobacter potus TaxID=2724927 RepID=A0ABR9YPR1_9PROT|nr:MULTISPECIES: DUF1328 domain-containing protein [Gluconobacter]MBF0849818.1 DUF1328 domain-containing protein [Gluconobacter sp. R75690]MBF0865746.1 DUF1328 domain-containing protein [Gluconobacter sp. R71656]MBF0868768.1 DUF1328 domain-containing protein [Gluconobacter sp. R75628]MBF0874750.1 DUF1328 domain-containing protein [Gluconobacter sp. R75629]MBF0878735.1 DUF1328 domain-containing protein [Gluconobacter sp. R75828]
MDLLRWTIAFLILALCAAVLGFGGISADFAYIGKILFFIFLVLLIISLIFGRGRGTRL